MRHIFAVVAATAVLLVLSLGTNAQLDDLSFDELDSLLDDLGGDTAPAGEPVIEKGAEEEPAAVAPAPVVTEPAADDSEDDLFDEPESTVGEPAAEEPEEDFGVEESADDFGLGELLGEESDEEESAAEEPAEAGSESDDWRALLGMEEGAADDSGERAVPKKTKTGTVTEDSSEWESDLGELGMAPEPTEVPFEDAPEADFVMTEEVPPQPEAAVGDYDEEEQLVKDKAREIEGMHQLALGEKALMHKEYEVALAHFRNAEDNLPDRVATADARRRADEGAMISQYYLAIQKMNIGELEGEHGARKLASDAYNRNRRFLAAKRLLERVELRIKEKEMMGVHDNLRRRQADDYKQKRSQTELWIQKAIQHMRVDELEAAEIELEKVLAVDKSNESAIALMKELQTRIRRVRLRERKALVVERIADVTDTWNRRDYGLSLPQEIGPEQGREQQKEKTAKERLMQKMQEIIIPDIAFRDANLHDVVQFLVNASREADSSTDEARRGVNIVLNIGDESAKSISLTARYVSLLEAVGIITEVADLKFRIQESIVMIIPKDAPTGRIVTRFYPVEPEVIQRVTASAASSSLDSGFNEGGGFLGNEGGGSGLVGEVGDLVEYFRNLGVDFPKGSSITYNSTIGKLIVANTDDNLSDFERVFNQLNVVSPQVEIETRFVDIQQTDLSELGIEWHLTDDWEMFQARPDLPVGARPRVAMRANTASGGFTKNLRFENSGDIGSLFAVQAILTNPELMALVQAIEQKGHADLLSAPRITTQPGMEATVKVATEILYPTEYRVEVGTPTVSGASAMLVAVPIVIPDVFEMREVGVILTVVPEVSPNQNVITLTIAPEVVTEPIWYDYGYALSDGTTIPMKMPFFNSRNATTTVKVYDGATVVMGGMISEGIQSKDDRIPLLGSLPLIGRLFRSKQELSDKRNLLIFVTARLVDPSGKPIKELKTASAMSATGSQ